MAAGAAFGLKKQTLSDCSFRKLRRADDGTRLCSVGRMAGIRESCNREPTVATKLSVVVVKVALGFELTFSTWVVSTNHMARFQNASTSGVEGFKQHGNTAIYWRNWGIIIYFISLSISC